jgi:cytochrome c-type biogenesis protein CcmH/NrfF
MEILWLVPIVFGVLVVVLGVIVLAVLIPAARREVQRKAEHDERDH